jgi:hypothetical protein
MLLVLVMCDAIYLAPEMVCVLASPAALCASCVNSVNSSGALVFDIQEFLPSGDYMLFHILWLVVLCSRSVILVGLVWLSSLHEKLDDIASPRPPLLSVGR